MTTDPPTAPAASEPPTGPDTETAAPPADPPADAAPPSSLPPDPLHDGQPALESRLPFQQARVDDRGRPLPPWEPLSAGQARQLVNAHHDHTGGWKALHDGRPFLVCGSYAWGSGGQARAVRPTPKGSDRSAGDGQTYSVEADEPHWWNPGPAKAPGDCTNDELRMWLTSRGAKCPKGWNKADRVKAVEAWMEAHPGAWWFRPSSGEG